MNDDLISREALLKAMEEERQYLLARGETGAEHILVHHCLPLIDNAPTVLHDNYSMGYQYGIKKVLSERPQGEWIEGYHDYFETLDCSICGYVRENRHSNFNFCPNCGTDMRGGRE